MPRKASLGRGLDALIPGGESSSIGGALLISVNQIAPNPRQPRSNFHLEELEELAASIKEHGVLQPLIVTLDPEDFERYILIAGERRWLAARMAGLDQVPVLLRDAGDQQRLELALIENVQRADLAPLETAEAYRQLAEDFSLSHEQIANRVSKSRSSVTNTLRLLKLPDEVRQALAEGQISEGHARALLALPTDQAQTAALQTILKQDLNVRQTEELVKRLNGHKPPRTSTSVVAPEISAVEERLRGRFGTKVRLAQHGKAGRIIIHYYSQEELDALVDQLVHDE
jgi:ParB family chromosome partitioning protein